MHVIEAYNLSKIYKGTHVPALDNISLKIEQGQIFTLLGRNGAGKTTFVRICATQLLPTSGTLKVLGYDVISQAENIRRFISVVPQEGRPLRALTPWDHVYNWLKIRGEEKFIAKIKTEKILERFELLKVKDKPAMNLSGGMKQKILVAMATAVDADLLFLDEPTIGLDPVSRRQVWNLMQDLKKEGKTILLTTHYMDEAEILSDKIVIIDNGKIVKEGNINDLRKIIPQNIRMDISKKNIVDIEKLKEYGNIVEIGTDIIRLFTFESSIGELSNLAIKNKMSFNISPITLDDIFVHLVGDTIKNNKIK
ncbi:MAG TPA: ABC transporter ATP-binding protein [Nitrososphaeraceae archaeon]|nr:ABC transporter ATP-binding protein [Nitrososphaeraceae archaeon]